MGSKGDSPKGARRRNDIATVGCWLIVGVGLLLAFLMTDWGACAPAREPALRRLCQQNLHSLYVACKCYAEDHQGSYPGTLSELCPDYMDGPLPFCPPSSAPSEHRKDIDRKASYAIVGGLNAQAGEQVLIYEKQSNHDGGGNVLYTTGRIEWVSGESLRLVRERSHESPPVQ